MGSNIKAAPGQLRNLRRRNGMTQLALATALGVSRSLVAHWESGRARTLVDIGEVASKLKLVVPPATRPRLPRQSMAAADHLSHEGGDRVVGKRIGTLRQQRGMTQRDLALALGVSRSLVARWESGRGGEVSHVTRIAKIFGVPDEVFLNGLSTDTVKVSVSVDELEFLGYYRKLATPNRVRLLKRARDLVG